MGMFALSSVLKAPRLGMRHKKDDNASLSPAEDSTATPSSSREDKSQKKRRLNAFHGKPPMQPSVISENSDTSSNEYSPRRSQRLAAKNRIDGDGDTWIECLVVNIKDRKRKTHKSRSLFYSIETQRGWWDEPPSGASNIVYLGQGRGLEVVPKKRRSFVDE